MTQYPSPEIELEILHFEAKFSFFRTMPNIFAHLIPSQKQIVTDPNIMNKSLKPRRFYYSPIGDGVVSSALISLI